jgi:hypothetical protein
MNRPTHREKKAKNTHKSQVRDLTPKKNAKGGTSFSYTKPEITYQPQKP